MRKTQALLAAAVLAGASLMPVAAQAKGCLKGAAVGGVAGHVAGKHGVLGATAGCIIGRHRANKAAKAEAAAAQTPAPVAPAKTK